MSTYEQRHGHPRTHKSNGSRDRDQHRKEANARNKERSKRSPAEQIAHLDSILGKGLGAKKERARLSKTMRT